MTPNPTLTNVLLDEPSRARYANRQDGHRLVMSVLPPDLGESPRSAAACLWHLDDSGLLQISAAVPVRGDALGHVLSTTPLPELRVGQAHRLALAVVITKTPSPDIPPEVRAQIKAMSGSYRSRSVIVPADERDAWIRRRLADRGLQAEDGSVEISDVQRADLGRRGATPFVDITLSATVTDADLANDALRHGIGKAKNFGLGLIRVLDPSSTSTTTSITTITKETRA